MSDKLATTSSGPSLLAIDVVRRSDAFSDAPLRLDSEKERGLVVNRAVRSRRNRSYYRC